LALSLTVMRYGNLVAENWQFFLLCFI